MICPLTVAPEKCTVMVRETGLEGQGNYSRSTEAWQMVSQFEFFYIREETSMTTARELNYRLQV